MRFQEWVASEDQWINDNQSMWYYTTIDQNRGQQSWEDVANGPVDRALDPRSEVWGVISTAIRL